MKLVITSILIFALIFTTLFVTSNAIKIDGAEQALEWKNAECIEIISKADSNKVDFSLLKYYPDSNGYDAYFLLYLTDSKSEKNDKCGFIFSLGDDFEMTITSDKVSSDFDNGLYNVDYKFNIIEDDGVYCEIKVAFKKGLPATINGTVSCIDGEGNNSYYYPFSFENFVETTVVTSERTTVKSTVKTSEKTTKEKTTSKPKTTKEKTTSKPKTTKQTTTKKEKSTSAKRNENKTVVYFYEKEVYISQVYVTETAPLSTVTHHEESTTAISTTATDSIHRSFLISEGVTAQKIICAVGGAVLIAFAAWAGLSAKKKPDKTSKETDQSSDSDKD